MAKPTGRVKNSENQALKSLSARDPYTVGEFPYLPCLQKGAK